MKESEGNHITEESSRNINAGYACKSKYIIDRSIKRAFDFLGAAFCLIIFSPLFLICYILIKKEDGGAAIFSQERIGLYGKTFNIYKFRSMKENAEENGPQLFEKDGDPRLTHIGAFLRNHHLDELP
ncbi:MAG TPA: sugar transferase, partial [Prevotella sp.]|nr:sugar transferase [Prevotella sp.]